MALPSWMALFVAETPSLFWMELAIFMVAGLVYAMFSENLLWQLPSRKTVNKLVRHLPSRKNGNKTSTLTKQMKGAPGDGTIDATKLTSHESLHKHVDKPWERVRDVESTQRAGRTSRQIMAKMKCAPGDGTIDTTKLTSRESLQTHGLRRCSPSSVANSFRSPQPPVATTSATVDRRQQPDKPPELVRVVESMQRAGRTNKQIMANLRAALRDTPSLLSSLEALPAAFLRDDAADLLDGMFPLLTEHGITSDVVIHSGLMAAQLRRFDYSAVATTAARVPAEMLTPKMRAMVAMSAAFRGQLDEAIDHIRHMPPPSGKRPLLAPTAIAQILTLAVREQRIVAVTEELQRAQAKLEIKHLEKLFATEGRAGGPQVCQELFNMASVLQVRRTAAMFQIFAGALGQAGDKAGLDQLTTELEEAVAVAGIVVGEPLAMALLDACGAVRDGSMPPRILEMHRTVCQGALSPRMSMAFCSALLACDHNKEACEYYEHEMLPKGVLPDVMLMNSLVEAAASCGNTALATHLSDHAATARPTVFGVSSTNGNEFQRHAFMIKAYGRDGNLTAASQVVARLKENGTPLTALIHNCYLDACVRCGDMGAALKQYDEMKQAGLLDVDGYNTMLKSHLAQGRPDDAQALLQEMAACGIQANRVTRALLQEMAVCGHQANKATFNALLHAGVKDTKSAWTLGDDVQKAGVIGF